MSTNPTRRPPPPDPSPDAQRDFRPPAPPPARQPPLELVPDGAWRTARWRRLRRRTLVLAGMALALGTVFGLVLVHVELTANEQRLTTLQRQAAQAEQDNLRLRLQVAQLGSPGRIVARAQQLGMEPPPTIMYLPADPGGSSSGTGAATSTATPPVTTPAASIQGWAASKRADRTP